MLTIYTRQRGNTRRKNASKASLVVDCTYTHTCREDHTHAHKHKHTHAQKKKNLQAGRPCPPRKKPNERQCSRNSVPCSPAVKPGSGALFPHAESMKKSGGCSPTAARITKGKDGPRNQRREREGEAGVIFTAHKEKREERNPHQRSQRLLDQIRQ